MFDELVESTSSRRRTHKPWAVVLSAVFQGLILGFLILIPLIYTQALPSELMTTFLVAPPPPPPPPPPVIQKIIHVEPKFIQSGKLLAPTVIPKKVEMIKEQPEPDVSAMVGGVPGGVPGGMAGGVMGGIIGGGGNLPPPPAPRRIVVGGNVQAANLIREVDPPYPQIARTAHVEGTVVLHAIIAKDGTIKQLQYISGPPLLMQAAMSAVHQWRYRPTLLNGQPVEVETTISVVFTLSGQ